MAMNSSCFYDPAEQLETFFFTGKLGASSILYTAATKRSEAFRSKNKNAAEEIKK